MCVRVRESQCGSEREERERIANYCYSTSSPREN